MLMSIQFQKGILLALNKRWLFRGSVGRSLYALQVEANKELNGVTAEGANVLPAKVIEDAFRSQYNKTLNFTDLKAGMQKVDSWYADRGIFGQVSATICRINM